MTGGCYSFLLQSFPRGLSFGVIEDWFWLVVVATTIAIPLPPVLCPFSRVAQYGVRFIFVLAAIPFFYLALWRLMLFISLSMQLRCIVVIVSPFLRPMS